MDLKKYEVFSRGYAMLPYNVIFDVNLSNTEKVLFSVLLALSSTEAGHCWARNKYLADILSVRPVTVSVSLKTLEKEGYIYLVFPDNDSAKRQIWIHEKMKRPITDPRAGTSQARGRAKYPTKYPTRLQKVKREAEKATKDLLDSMLNGED
jgi:hypothetical protein